MRPFSEHNRATPPTEFGRLLGRLPGLPLRPLTARAALAAFEGRSTSEPEAAPPRFLRADPGWCLGVAVDGEPAAALGLVADCPWWRATSPAADDAIERLWRHAVAAQSAARRLADEAGRSDADRVGRAALLHQLGLWAVAAVAPEALAEILALPRASDRRNREVALIGRDAAALGRDLAERWGCGPLVVDAAWLHGDDGGTLNGCASDPEALAIIQQAFDLAERTPWALGGSPRLHPGPTEPRVRILIAEVQVRCSAGLLDREATSFEEELTRKQARLLIQNAELNQELAARDRLLTAIADHAPTDTPEAWADRASRLWCAEPGVTSARVDLTRTGAEVHLRSDPASAPSNLPTLPAWRAFADLVGDRDRQTRRLDAAVNAHRDQVAREQSWDRTAKLDALAEFAAGAGHELNNPLAVILGRAQLLLPVVTDPAAARSLRTIIGQAQRAHRILRDLMYVARPPAPRPRPCQPDEIVRACLRDMKDEAEARGVRLVAETTEPVPVAWADPDPLRHMADVLVRNALEATPTGGTVRFATGKSGDRMAWTVKDSGRGITASEGHHLFDPFFCGRQAGRGLGLGLPRVARFVSQVGGELTWKSTPGVGTVFAVTLPIEPTEA